MRKGTTIWKLLGLQGARGREPGGAEQGEASDAVREIIDHLERLEPDRARHIASFAYVLGRVAHADLDISREETRAMERIVRALGGLEEEEAILVVQIAKAQHRLFGSTDSYVVTREFSRTSTREQKTALLECLFAVSAADQTVSGAEESEIRRVAGELDLTHADFIAARLKFRQHIGALKGDPKEGPRRG